jgi:hypothetical protein
MTEAEMTQRMKEENKLRRPGMYEYWNNEAKEISFRDSSDVYWQRRSIL